MKEKGGHFIPSLGLAIAAHALLFLLFFWFLPHAPLAPKVALVEVQFSGTTGDGGVGGGVPAASRAARPTVRTAPTPPAAPTPAPEPTVTTLSTPPSNAPAPEAASAAADGASSGGTGGAGSGDGSGAGSGSGEGSGTGGEPGDWGAAPPATVADIDPTPFRPIFAAYPPSARFLGQQGLVRVQAEVDADGIVTGERIAKSSGFTLLDNAALDAVRSARFLPAMKNGKTVAAMVIIPVRFRLTQD